MKSPNAECGDASATMKVLAVHRYFWPDAPPYASMLRCIAERWHADGHSVEVLSAQPSYKPNALTEHRPKREVVNGVIVYRLSLPWESGRPIVRLINAARLGLAVLWRALTRRYDVIMISTVPPVVGGFMAALAARLTGARFIYHCMDLHPEIGRLSGEFAHPVVYKALLKMDSWTCRQADPVVVLSGDMKNTLQARPGGHSFSVEVLNNFSLPSDEELPERLPFAWNPDAVTILFAGNIGRFQGLGTLVEAMSRLQDLPEVECVLMGEGSAKRELEQQAERLGGRIRFLGHQPVEVAKLAMRHADLGYVSLTKEMYRYAYPSKTMTYLEQGCPLLVSVEEESEIAREVGSGGYGCAVRPGDSGALEQLLRGLVHRKADIQSMRELARRRFEEAFDQGVVLGKWSDLLGRNGVRAK